MKIESGSEFTIRSEIVNKNIWVVVDNPGTDIEKVVDQFTSFEDACRFKSKCSDSDIMKYNNSGLTTEY